MYRIGTNEIGTYQYSRWVEPPVELVKDKLIRMLRASGDYQSVTSLGSNSKGQFVVRGRLYDFEEVDGANITGLVSMEFELYDRKSGKVVWTHFYSQSEPAQGKEISAVVTALDTNLDRGLKEVAVGLNQYFSANPVGKSSEDLNPDSRRHRWSTVQRPIGWLGLSPRVGTIPGRLVTRNALGGFRPTWIDSGLIGEK